jgi:hypothetical protein
MSNEYCSYCSDYTDDCTCIKLLQSAVANEKNMKVVSQLIEKSSFSARSIALYSASFDGNFFFVKKLVDKGTEIYLTEQAVIRASSKGQLHIVAYILGEEKKKGSGIGSDLQKLCDHAFVFAAAADQRHILSFLLSFFPKEYIQDSFNQSLTWSAENGHLSTVEYLCELCPIDSFSLAFSKAATNGHTKIVKFLFEKKGELIDVNYDNSWPIKKASANGHFDVLRFLVEDCGAILHTRDRFAWKSSIEFNHIHIVQYLVESGAYLLSHEILFTPSISMIEYLVEEGAPLSMFPTSIRLVLPTMKKSKLMVFILDFDNKRETEFSKNVLADLNVLLIVFSFAKIPVKK